MLFVGHGGGTPGLRIACPLVLSLLLKTTWNSIHGGAGYMQKYALYTESPLRGLL